MGGAQARLAAGPWSFEMCLLSALGHDVYLFVVSQWPLDVASGDPQSMRQWLQGNLDFALPPPPTRLGTAELVGGRLRSFFTQRVAAFMYTADGHDLVLYVMPHQG